MENRQQSRNTMQSLISLMMTKDKHEGFQTFIIYQEQYKKNLHGKKMTDFKQFFLCKHVLP